MKKYFVIGNPIDHSLSPKLHNHWLKKNNINAIYDKIKLEENEIKNFIQDIKQQKIIGCNVTVPFKKSVIPFLDKLSLAAEQTQSVNTIVSDDGYLVGHNTDIDGFELSIKKLNYDVNDKTIMILGAGGVVPSIIYALKRMNAGNIIISNRTKEKAEALKEKYSYLKLINWGETVNSDIIINATSIGLKESDEINVNYPRIGSNKLFYDVIYNPSKTRFLLKAEELNNQIENGKMMFIYQAQLSFKIWHNITPKVDDSIIKLLNDD